MQGSESSVNVQRSAEVENSEKILEEGKLTRVSVQNAIKQEAVDEYLGREEAKSKLNKDVTEDKELANILDIPENLVSHEAKDAIQQMETAQQSTAETKDLTSLLKDNPGLANNNILNPSKAFDSTKNESSELDNNLREEIVNPLLNDVDKEQKPYKAHEKMIDPQNIFRESEPESIATADKEQRSARKRAENVVELPVVCLNFPLPQGTYGLLYVELEKTAKIPQLKSAIGREYNIDASDIKVYNGGTELTNDLVVSLSRFRDEILCFAINLSKVDLNSIKANIKYEKYFKQYRRPIGIADYCHFNSGVSPYYWFERSSSLYSRANHLVSSLKEDASNSKNLKELVEIDANLIDLWQHFEKTSMMGIDRMNEGVISSVRLPGLFGYPELVYSYSGVVIFRTHRGDVTFSATEVGMAQERQSPKSSGRKAGRVQRGNGMHR